MNNLNEYENSINIDSDDLFEHVLEREQLALLNNTYPNEHPKVVENLDQIEQFDGDSYIKNNWRSFAIFLMIVIMLLLLYRIISESCKQSSAVSNLNDLTNSDFYFTK